MKLTLAEIPLDRQVGEEATESLRRCVHCGFCNAVCPTYALLADELDGPRGRIYLIKAALEGQAVSEKTRLHLDRCLHCLACEAGCPSGVRLGRLFDIGKAVVETRVPRRIGDAGQRAVLRALLPRPGLFAPLLAMGRLLRPLLPGKLAARIPRLQPAGLRPNGAHPRRMLLLAGCVQPALAPNINAATARVLDRLGIAAVEIDKAGCCGALRQHLNDGEGALDDARRNIDAWWPEIERGAEAIVVTASGCGVQVRDYGHLLRYDPQYGEMAARVSALCRDPSEVLAAEGGRLQALLASREAKRGRLAFQSPCSLQHGLRLGGVVERLLLASGFELTPVRDGQLCCGSAGTYSLLQPELSQQLHAAKLAALLAGQPEGIATANIGCLTHLQNGCSIPVRHWIELIDEILK